MAQLLVLVLDRVEQFPEVLSAWQEAGVPGVTVVESTGLGRLRGVMRDDLPLFPSLRGLLASHELHHRTLLSVIEDDEAVERVVAATRKIIGDFSGHHTGILFSVPVSWVLGLKKGYQDDS